MVVVPPGWAHAVISADPVQPLIFGAWCDREYGFIYDDIRAKGGLAWYPLVGENGKLAWHRNRRYRADRLHVKTPESYESLGLRVGISIYRQFENHAEAIRWVSKPYTLKRVWDDFVP